MIFIDTETTGLIKPSAIDINLQPHIIEIYACKVNKKFKITKEFKTLVKPPVEISEFISRLTGITDDKLKKAPAFITIFDKLYKFFRNEKLVIGHNISFDMNMIRIELERLDLQHNFCWPKTRHCTVELSQSIKNHRLSLDALYKIATNGQELPKRHRAKVDVMALITCYEWLMNKGYIKT